MNFIMKNGFDYMRILSTFIYICSKLHIMVILIIPIIVGLRAYLIIFFFFLIKKKRLITQACAVSCR